MLDILQIGVYNLYINQKGDKIMKKKKLSTQEMFCGMPRLKDYFMEMDRTIRAFSPKEGVSEGIEDLKKKRKELWETVEQMDSTDLRIIYYLHKQKRINSLEVVNSLKKLFLSQEELKALLKAESEG